MNKAKFEEIVKIEKYDLYKKEAYLRSIMLPSIKIEHENRSKENVGLSKQGGFPEVPEDFEWPKHEFGDYQFALQINLSEIKFETPLPKTGMLSFFIANDDDKNVFFGAKDYGKIYYFEEGTPLKTYVNPNLNYFNIEYCLRIDLHENVDIPYREDLFKEKGLNKKQMDYVCDKIPDMVSKKTYSYLFGYPYYNTLGYDPRKTDEWVSLLTLRSNISFSWDWDWDEFLMFFIEKDKLAKGDFSNIRTDLG